MTLPANWPFGRANTTTVVMSYTALSTTAFANATLSKSVPVTSFCLHSVSRMLPQNGPRTMEAAATLAAAVLPPPSLLVGVESSPILLHPHLFHPPQLGPRVAVGGVMLPPRRPEAPRR